MESSISAHRIDEIHQVTTECEEAAAKEAGHRRCHADSLILVAHDTAMVQR